MAGAVNLKQANIWFEATELYLSLLSSKRIFRWYDQLGEQDRWSPCKRSSEKRHTKRQTT
jgi:hypothetical protein